MGVVASRNVFSFAPTSLSIFYPTSKSFDLHVFGGCVLLWRSTYAGKGVILPFMPSGCSLSLLLAILKQYKY